MVRRRKRGTKMVQTKNVLLKRHLPEFGLDLLWDGSHVVLDLGHTNKPIVGQAFGVRTATSLMTFETEKLHRICCEMDLSL